MEALVAGARLGRSTVQEISEGLLQAAKAFKAISFKHEATPLNAELARLASGLARSQPGVDKTNLGGWQVPRHRTRPTAHRTHPAWHHLAFSLALFRPAECR